MKPMITARQLLTQICVLPAENSIKSREKLFQMCSAFIIILSIFALLVSSAVYIHQFISIDLENTLFAISHLFAYFPALYGFVILLIKRQSLKRLFAKWDEIYQSRKLFFNQ